MTFTTLHRVEYSRDGGQTWELWTNYYMPKDAEFARQGLEWEHGAARIIEVTSDEASVRETAVLRKPQPTRIEGVNHLNGWDV